MFSDNFEKKAKSIISNYPKKRYALLPLLHLVQKEKGFINNDSVHYLAELCDVSFNHIQGVISFYSMFTQKQRGKHQISVCTNLSCWIRGANKIVEYLEEKVGVSVNHNSMDKNFFLEEVECLGACGYAPVMILDDKYYEQLTPEKIDEILDKLPIYKKEQVKTDDIL